MLQLTIGKILKNIMNVNVNLPAIVADTGFKEALISFNMGPPTTTMAGDEVPTGLYVVGVLFSTFFRANEGLYEVKNFME